MFPSRSPQVHGCVCFHVNKGGTEAAALPRWPASSRLALDSAGLFMFFVSEVRYFSLFIHYVWEVFVPLFDRLVKRVTAKETR